MTAASPRKLVLLRHAKSAWPDVPDHERPLAGRGRRTAPAAGRWLRRAACVPDQVLCSTARRARETWQLAATGLGVDPPVAFEPGIYGASAIQLLDIIRGAPSAARILAVIGHDPAVQELALALTGTVSESRNAPSPAPLERMTTKFPTAAIAVLEFSGPWSELRQGRARLTDFVTPREMGAGGDYTPAR